MKGGKWSLCFLFENKTVIIKGKTCYKNIWVKLEIGEWEILQEWKAMH